MKEIQKHKFYFKYKTLLKHNKFKGKEGPVTY